ncbi:NmrA domain-containing protein [Mycena chlorophos]|uniref:NmrA domain-containing protein n=1 Tax=Mycena chlorophos TaxID=658473 RepID=A0A8H6SM69_MYCCL|nr:NmrA domain-containing protein [Mycena chlorophos]
MADAETILYVGATGYIGGTVLHKLLGHTAAQPEDSRPRFVALVRDAEKAEKLKTFGIEAVVGETADVVLLERLASEAAVVFSMAESDNVASANALLSGCKTRFEKTGKETILIHTSGAGAIADMACLGAHSNSPTWDDLDLEQLSRIRSTQLHRPVDLQILAADEPGYIKSYIVLPTTVWGIASTPLVEAGIQRQHNTLLTHMVPPAIDRRQGGIIGEGKNVWGNVEVHELADLFLLIYTTVTDPALSPQAGHGQAGLYFAENGSNQLRQVSEAISQTLFEAGHAANAETTTFGAEELKESFPFAIVATLIASDAKCSAHRARALGWTPRLSTKEFLENVKVVTRNYLELGRAA